MTRSPYCNRRKPSVQPENTTQKPLTKSATSKIFNQYAARKQKRKREENTRLFHRQFSFKAFSTFSRVARYPVFSTERRLIKIFSLTQYRPAMPFGNRKKNLEHLSSLVLSQFEKYHPSRNLKFNNLGIFSKL